MTEPPVHVHAPNGVKNAFTQKIGPLPGYAYVVIIVLVAYMYRRYKGGKSSALPVAGTAMDPNASSTSPSSSLGGTSYTGGGGAQPASAATSSSTNGQWSNTAANALIASGANATDVGNALSNYLNGLPLTPTQEALVNKAIAQFGEPPQGVLPITQVVPPAPPAPPAPSPTYSWLHPAPGTVYRRNNADGAIYQDQPGLDALHLAGWQWDQLQATYGPITLQSYGSAPAAAPTTKPAAPKPGPASAARRYTVKGGDSLSSIAQHYYGNSNDWQRIYNANKGVIGSNPNLIRAGEVLTIP